MSSGTGKPSDNHSRFQPQVGGPGPMLHEAIPETPGNSLQPGHRRWPSPEHDSPALRSREGDAPRRSALLAQDRRPGRSELDRREPAGQPGTEWDRCDDIIQQLFAIGVAMRVTERRCKDHPEIAARIVDHMADLQRIVKELRSTTPEPPPLHAQSILG